MIYRIIVIGLISETVVSFTGLYNGCPRPFMERELLRERLHFSRDCCWLASVVSCELIETLFVRSTNRTHKWPFVAFEGCHRKKMEFDELH